VYPFLALTDEPRKLEDQKPLGIWRDRYVAKQYGLGVDAMVI